MVAAHVDHGGDKGMGTKVSDRFAIPLSWLCHDLQHSKGWPWFESNILRADAVAMSQAYWELWPKRREWEARNAQSHSD